MLTIVSGGQTGADRGAMDAAIELGLDFGGWAPAGFRAEDGRIPQLYASRMREAEAGIEHRIEASDYVIRTRHNVRDSDATLLLTFEPKERLTGGTAFTSRVCRQQGKQCVHLRMPRPGSGEQHPDEVKDGVLAWLRLWRVQTLNVAGPRESKAPGIQRAAKECLVWILREVAVAQVRTITRTMEQLARGIDATGGLTAASRNDLGDSIRRAEVELRYPIDDDEPVSPTDSDAPASTYMGVPDRTAEFLADLESCPRPPEQGDIDALKESFYELPGNGAGGSLHVVLDDHNWERECVEFCRKYAVDRGDTAGERFAQLLLTLADEQLRAWLGSSYCGICGADYGDMHARNDRRHQTFPPGPCPECGSEPEIPAPGVQAP